MEKNPAHRNFRPQVPPVPMSHTKINLLRNCAGVDLQNAASKLAEMKGWVKDPAQLAKVEALIEEAKAALSEITPR